MNEAARPEEERFEFTIDGERLYAPRERMMADELVQIAVEQGVLEDAADGYALKDDTYNTMVGETLIVLYRGNTFHSIPLSA